MNLWLVERTDDVGYDEFIGCVVAAEDEAQARRTGPYWTDGAQEKDWWPNLRVTYIGISHEDARRVILDSFNAG